MFFESSVEQVKGGQYVKQVGSEKSVDTYESFIPNRPVNVRNILTFYKSMIERDGGRLIFPTIKFVPSDAERLNIIWHYPPTQEGEEQRDKDFNFIRKHNIMQCSVNNSP